MAYLDRVEKLYKTSLRIFGVLSLAAGLWMVVHYQWGPGKPDDVPVLASSSSFEDTARLARTNERNAGLVLGASGAILGVGLLCAAELVSRAAQAARKA